MTNRAYREAGEIAAFSMQLMSGPNDECVWDEATAREAVSFLFDLPMEEIRVEVESVDGELVENGITWLAPVDEATAHALLSDVDVETSNEFSGYSVYVPGCPA